MVPLSNVIAWAETTPWSDLNKIEQDLILSRAIVALFEDPSLRRQLRFRGGTALGKLHFPAIYRLSEDIDLARTVEGPVGPILDHIRSVLEPWLGKARRDLKRTSARLKFQVPAEDDPELQIGVKVEVNTVETDAYDPPAQVPFRVENPWFSGAAEVATFSREEMLATKLRALLQRDKGRDLFDLAHGLEVFEDLDADRIVRCLGFYLDRAGLSISRAEAERRMFDKLARSTLAHDIRHLLPAVEAARIDGGAVRTAFTMVFTGLISRLPGKP
ncbi:MAG: nucleotidyl transferase AbiEii/AbiGii toxin family protein [Gammaproteobacteria bacterium]|nr:nucleotidyl transferase AbiEii/AbiGii toxin family protein [Gammaproteobacteria bacterium]